MGIVHANQLAKTVVLIGRCHVVSGFARNVPAVIVCIGEVHRVRIAALG